jgi:hypothetical protein
VQSDKTVESLQEFFKELNAIRQPISADELNARKNYEALGFPSEFETTAGMAGNLIQLVIYGLPETFFTEYVPKILAVTSADATRVANQYIQPDRFAVIVVGDLAKIEKGIRAANLGPVKVCHDRRGAEVAPSAQPIVIVGAGAAGLVAAIFAARQGARVVLLEAPPTAAARF